MLICKNIIHIGDRTYDFDSLGEEEKIDIAVKLNKQALTAVGYREYSENKSKDQATGGSLE